MKVGVIGAGTMGAGICEVFAKAGWDVAMTACCVSACWCWVWVSWSSKVLRSCWSCVALSICSWSRVL